ncbi:MAG: tetratricopeptide repeat-containing sensor histidine kinase [Bacteroidia bacterium]
MKNKKTILTLLLIWFFTGVISAQTCDTSKINELCTAAEKNMAVDIVKACDEGSKAYVLAKDCKQTNHYLKAVIVFTNGLYQKDLGDSAIAILNDALKSNSNISSYYKARIFHKLSSCYVMTMQLENGLKYCFESLKNYEITKDSANQANIYTNIANVYQQQHNFDLAVTNLRKALSIAKKINKKKTLGNVFNTLGILYAENQRLDSAEYFFVQSTKIREELNDNTVICWNYNNLGGLYVLLKKPEKAIYYLEKALDKFKAIENYDGQSSAANNLAELYMNMNDQKKALYYYSYSRQLYSLTNNPDNLENLYNNLSVYYDKIGDIHTAFKYSDSLIVLKDSLYGKRLTSSLAEMQVKFDVEKKNLEIAMQKDELEIKDKKNKLKNIILISVIVTSVLIILMIGLLFQRSKLKQKQLLDAELLKQQEIRSKAVLEAEEKERVRIARELHDGIGQQLSAARLNVAGLQTALKINSEEERTLLQNAVELLDDSVKEVRTVSHSMMPNALIKSGLVSAVREFIHRISAAGNLKVNLEIVGLTERLEQTTETVLFRVLQELVNNIIKHANASEISIQLVKHEAELSIVVEDNGKGFNVSKTLNEAGGIGLKNIQSRINFLNGNVFFDSFPGKGTTVTIELPV